MLRLESTADLTADIVGEPKGYDIKDLTVSINMRSMGRPKRTRKLCLGTAKSYWTWGYVRKLILKRLGETKVFGNMFKIMCNFRTVQDTARLGAPGSAWQPCSNNIDWSRTLRGAGVAIKIYWWESDRLKSLHLPVRDNWGLQEIITAYRMHQQLEGERLVAPGQEYHQLIGIGKITIPFEWTVRYMLRQDPCRRQLVLFVSGPPRWGPRRLSRSQQMRHKQCKEDREEQRITFCLHAKDPESEEGYPLGSFGVLEDVVLDGLLVLRDGGPGGQDELDRSVV